MAACAWVQGERGAVVDQLGPGDTFGYISLLSGLSPAVSIRAGEDTLLYVLPDPRTVLKDSDRLRFSHYGSLMSRPRMTKAGILDAASGPVGRFARPIIWCEPGTTAQEAARRITAAGTSCALVHAEPGMAIVTDSDFRRAAGKGQLTTDTLALTLGHRPVLTVAEDAPVATAFLRMLEHGVHHLVLLSRSGQPTGVVRVVDLTSAETRDPLLIREAIRGATTLEQLQEACRMLHPTAVELAETGIPALQIASLLTAVVEAVLRRLVDLDGGLAHSTPAASLLVLGSLARSEVLPRSDVDTALVCEDPSGLISVASQMRDNAERLIQQMESCGLPRCPDGANASNPLFSRSVAGWEAAAAGWIRDDADSDTLLLTSIVADRRRPAHHRRGRHADRRAYRDFLFADAAGGRVDSVRYPPRPPRRPENAGLAHAPIPSGGLPSHHRGAEHAGRGVGKPAPAAKDASGCSRSAGRVTTNESAADRLGS
jgi:CBS domain-containing protein